MRTPETEVGHTGARFGPTGVRPTVGERDAVDPDPIEERELPIGARFGPHSQRRRRRPEPREPEPPAEVARPEARRTPPEEPLLQESDVLIRPYARTGGRTKPTLDLALESLISTSGTAAGSSSSWEHRLIANLCLQPRSVAEVAARLSIPLGVAQILLVDMAAAGIVTVHGGTGRQPPDMLLMQRVLTGLRRL